MTLRIGRNRVEVRTDLGILAGEGVVSSCVSWRVWYVVVQLEMIAELQQIIYEMLLDDEGG